MITYVFIVIVTGIPILSLDNCSAIASFTCIVNEPAMHWEIHFSGDNMIERVNFFLSDTIKRPISVMNVGTGVIYHFNLISKSPLTSTMTTDTPNDLSGAKVICSDEIDADACMTLLSKSIA